MSSWWSKAAGAALGTAAGPLGMLAGGYLGGKLEDNYNSNKQEEEGSKNFIASGGSAGARPTIGDYKSIYNPAEHPYNNNWAQLATQKQNAEEAGSREAGIRQVGAQRGGAMSQLASRGGMDSGARERLARGSMKDTLDMNQNIAKQGGLNRMQIGINDETNRIAAENDRTNNEMKNKQLSNEFDMQKYSEQMKAWAANKQADATIASGKQDKGFFGNLFG